MVRSLYLIYVLAICSLHLSPLTHAQFLSSDSPVATVTDIDTSQSVDDTAVEFNANTPEEIKIAMSENIAKLLQRFGQMMIDANAAAIQNPNTDLGGSNSEKSESAFAGAIGNTLVKSAQSIADAIGSLAADSVAAFKEAQTIGGDVGAAVGGVIVDALGELNNNAEAIGDSIQQEFDAVFATLENVPEEYAAAFNYAGEGVERLINAVANRADAIGKIVAQAVNNAVSQGGSYAEQLGNGFAGLAQALIDNAENVGDIASETMAGFEGANEEKLAGLKGDIVRTIQTISADEVGSGVTEVIDLVSGDKLFGTPAQSDVEIINRLGQLLLQVFPQNPQ